MIKNNTLILSVLTISLLVFSIPSLFAADWEVKDVPVSDTLYGVHFVDANNGWAVGENGAIIHTSDGGEEWQKQDAPISDLILYDVYFVDAQKGWAVGGVVAGMAAPDKNTKPNRQATNDINTFYVIIHTEDGGETWTVQKNDEALSVLKSVCFVDADNGWAVGSGNFWNAQTWDVEERAIILRTSDGGQNWQGGDIPLMEGGFVGGELNGVHFVDTQRGWTVGGSVAFGTAYVLNTENGGANWFVTQGPVGFFQDVYFTDDQNGWVVGFAVIDGVNFQPLIYHTTDGGQNWIPQVDTVGIALYGVHFVTPQEGWTVGIVGNIFGYEGAVYHTGDAGFNWEPEALSASGVQLFDVHDAGKVDLWMVGERGNVLRKRLAPPLPVFTVTNLNDDGEGSLRWAIEQANANPGADTIDFSISGTIFPKSVLPEITDDGTVIDASPQWDGGWPEGQPGVTLDGTDAGDAAGLSISSANHCHIRGLFITNFGQGITINNGSQFNTVGGTEPGHRNVISGNRDGVVIVGSNTNNNVVSGNYIGTNATGTEEMGNSETGVAIMEGAQFNTIGGITESERNIISGNKAGGVWLSDSGTDNNKILGNYIGVNVGGDVALGNEDGVGIGYEARSNIIGGATEGERNIISGNAHNGVWFRDLGTNNNKVLGNYIGTDVTGTVALGNAGDGVNICCEAQLNTIGGTTKAERNIISGNGGNGIWLSDSGTKNNKVSSNYIGTDASGTIKLANLRNGVGIIGGAQNNIIGGTTEGERNIISGNNEDGVRIEGAGTNNNKVSGNYIGTNANGTAALGNSGIGVSLDDGTQDNTIGGTTKGERNIISGNDGPGVNIAGAGTNNNKVSGNYIGTDLTGTVDLGNSASGVDIVDRAQSNTIGGTTAGERNIISGNDSNGVWIINPGTDNNTISGNYIGTNAKGDAALENLHNGVYIGNEAQFNTIGGNTQGARNIISGNVHAGVSIADSSTNNVVAGNYIGTDVNGTKPIENKGNGVDLGDGANTIGGTTEGERNIISGNGGNGIHISGSGTHDNKVVGNYIGTDVNGTADLGNSGHGITIVEGAQTNTIGGTTSGERNIISGNYVGVSIETSNNKVLGNYIGTDVSGTLALGNSYQGINIGGGAQLNIIGGTGAEEGNIIAFNGADGIVVNGTDADYNKISGNSIHDSEGIGIELFDGGNDEIPPSNITSNSLVGNILTVSGNDAGANATVEIFEADSFESGEGRTYLGSLPADGGGNFSGTVDVTGRGLSIGEPLVATTTHINNNTSEFSAPETILSVSFLVISIEPDNGRLAGGTSVTITGSMFEQGATVTIGGEETSNVKVVSDTTITAVTPPGKAGSADVVVTNPGGESATGAGLYTYNPMPTVTGIAPASGALNGGNQVTITGTGFLNGLAVTIGGKDATNVQVISTTTITTTVPKGDAPDAVDVVVTNPDTQSAKGEYTYLPPPTISSVTPDSGPVAGGNSINIIGKDFVQGLTVTIGGKQTTITASSATEITVKVPAGDLGVKDVIVTNPDGQQDTSAYTYRSRTFTLSRTEGFVGDDVKASGSGYAENSDIGKLIFDGSVISDLTDAGAGSVIDEQINSDAAGTFEVFFKIPTHIGGTFTVEVGSVSANLKIKARIAKVAPEKGAAGTEITVSGDGFFANEKITIDFGATEEIALATAGADGSFTETFIADEQQPDTKNIKATGGQSGQFASANFELTESVQVISPTLSSLTTTTPKVDANGYSEAIVNITIRDEKGKPVKNANLTVSVTGSNNTFEQPKLTDDNGETTVKIVSTKAETKMVTAVAEDVSVSDSVKIRFKPGEPSKLTVESNIDKIQADGASQATINITVFDKNENPVPSETVDVEIEPVVGKVKTPAEDNGDGTYTSTYTAGDIPGDVTITVWTSNGKSAEAKIALTVVDKTAEIINVTVEGSPAKAGAQISVTLNGEAGCEASFSIENVTENIQMEEGESGVYTGTYAAKEGDNAVDAVVTVTLKDTLNNVNTDSSYKITLDTTPPPAPTDLTATPELIDASNQKSITISGKTTPEKKVTVKLADKNQKELVGDAEATADGNFNLVIDASSLSDGIVRITVQEEPDAAGNVGAEGEIIAWKDTTTIKADFDISVIESQKTARVGGTAVYIITVTGVNNFQQPVTLMSVYPKGISIEFSQNPLTPTPTNPTLYPQLTMTIGTETKEGIYDIEVYGHSGGASKNVKLTLTVEEVKLTPILTIQLTGSGGSPSPQLGEKVSIAGSLVAQEGTLPTKVNLTATYQKPSGKTVEQFDSTDDKNAYVLEYTPDEVGEWKVTVKWAGNDVFKEAVTQSTFEVRKGNSTIQFDIDDKLSLGSEIAIIAHLNPALPNETVNLRVITPPPDNITFASESLETNEYGRFEWSFTPAEEGDWTLKATYDGNENYKPAEGEFTLHVIGKQAKAIVVLGGGDKIENPDWNKFNAVAEYVYKTLLKRKLKPDDIYFLSTEKDITKGCDDRTSFEVLESAITNWAKGRVDQHTPLYIYLLSHNRDDKFLLDIQDGKNIVLTAEQLDKWLDQLPEDTKVTVIIEACYSGNFIKTLTARNRTIITSAVHEEKAYLRPNKDSFSKFFFDFIYRNKDIGTAFAETIDLMENIPTFASQNPQLDADWDGIPNEPDDFDELAKVYIPKDTPSLADEMEILNVTPAQTLSEGKESATIQARVKYANEETLVTAAIFSPEFAPEKDEPIIVIFTPVNGELYEFTYNDFNKTGRYVIQINADNPEESAIPQATAVTVAPSTGAWDVNNDNSVDITDLVLVGKNFGTSSKIGDVNDDGRVDISDLVLVGKHFGETY